MMLHIELFL